MWAYVYIAFHGPDARGRRRWRFLESPLVVMPTMPKRPEMPTMRPIPLKDAYPDLQKMLDDKNARIQDLENQIADLDKAVNECALTLVGDILNNILAAYIRARFDHAELGKAVESILGLAIVKPRALEELDEIAAGTVPVTFTITPVEKTPAGDAATRRG